MRRQSASRLGYIPSFPAPCTPQTALAVAVAEEACQFEDRDLHWGNLLIRRSEAPAATAAVAARLRGVDLEAATGGVTVRHVTIL